MRILQIFMRLFEVQTSATASGAWPAEPPPVHPISHAPRLHLPLAARPGYEGPLPAAVDGEVAESAPLTEAPLDAEHAAIAPVAGRGAGLDKVSIIGGASVPAAILDGDPALPATPRPDAFSSDLPMQVLDVLPSIQPGDLGGWIDRLRHAGVWAHRRTSPNLLAQLHQLLSRPVDAIVCNAMEEGSGTRLSSLLASRYPHAMLLGLGIVQRLTGVRRTLVLVEQAAPSRWWTALRRAMPRGISMTPLRNDYPQPDPTLILYSLLGRRLRPGRLPTEQGVLLLDPAASIAIGHAAREQSMARVPLTVFDHARFEAHYLTAAVGTPVRHVLEQIGMTAEPATIRAGHVLRDLRVDPAAVVGGGELTLDVSMPESPANPHPCIRCAWCIEGCPTRLNPAGVLEAAQQEDRGMAERYGIEACIECGICSYVCPSQLPLLQSIRQLRGQGIK